MSDEQGGTLEVMETTEREHRMQIEGTAPSKTEEIRLEQSQIDELQSRWNLIQKDFVDEPHTSVQQAEVLVGETVDKVTQMLSERKSSLHETIDGREDISTEDLRIALQLYRSFFNRLLAI